MTALAIFYRIEQMHQMILMQSTGSPEQFARRIGVSRRTLFLWLEQLREDFHFPIEYDKAQRTYYYSEEGNFEFGFKKN